MNKTLKLFSLVAGFATLGSQFDVCASDPTSSDNEEIVSYRTALNGTEELFPVTAMTGFSGTEATHTWSLDDKASLSFSLFRNDKRLIEVSLPNTSALVTGHHQQQTVTVGFVDGRLEDYEYTTANPYQSIVMQLPKNLTGDAAVLEFYTPNSCLVSVAMPGALDARKLGISVNSVLLKYAKDEPTPSTSKKTSTPPPLKQMETKASPNSGGMGDLAQQLASAKLKRTTSTPSTPKTPTTAGSMGDFASQALYVKLRTTPSKQPADVSEPKEPILAVVLRPTSPKTQSAHVPTEPVDNFPKLKPTGINLIDDNTGK